MKYENSIDISTYKNYLKRLKNEVWKIIPLYQEKNEHVISYVDTICREVFGIRFGILELPHDHWYTKVYSTLEALSKKSLDETDFNKVRKEVFKMLNAIDKELKQMKGE